MKLIVASFFSALVLAAFTATAAINDVFPTDYIALKDGSVNLVSYLYRREQVGPYTRSKRLIDGNLNTDIAAMRISRFFDVGEHQTFSSVAVLSWAQSNTSPAQLAGIMGQSAQGMGDLRLGGTYWLNRDREKREYLAANMFVILPTGSYDQNRLINIGENRWKWVLGGGWMQPLGEKWIIDVAPEIVFYGKNPRYLVSHTLEQNISSALTGYLRYRITPQWQLMAGAQLNRGGETIIDGVDQHNAPENTRLSIGTIFVTEKQRQWQLRLSQDTSTESGFKTTSELVLRYSLVF